MLHVTLKINGIFECTQTYVRCIIEIEKYCRAVEFYLT